MRFRRTRIVAAVAAAALVLAGCAGGGGGGAATAGDTSELKVGLTTAPVSMDPLKAASGASNHWFSDPAYTGLLKQGRDGEILPNLAEEWGYVGDDNTHFELTLRDGLKFADGTDLDAQAVVDSLNHFTETSTGPTVAYFRAFTYEAPDARTVKVTSATPNPMIDKLMTTEYYGAAPISAAGIADPEAMAEKTFGAGPYVLDNSATIVNDRYVYTPNEHYFDQDGIHYEKITISVIPNVTQLVQALRTGQVDVMVGDSTVGGTVTDAGFTEISKAGGWRGVILYDRDGVNVPALADVRVRQAMNHAVDRAAITAAAYGEYGTPTAQPTAAGDPSFGFDSALDDMYPYDVERARELMAEAGYADGFTMPMHYQSFQAADTRMIQAVAAQLEEIGITLDMKPNSNFAEWVGDLVGGQFGGTVLGTGGPIYLTASWAFGATGVMNPFQVSVPEVNDALAALASASPDESEAAAQAVTRAVVESASGIPIAQVNTVYIFNDKVGGLEYLASGYDLSLITDWYPAE